MAIAVRFLSGSLQGKEFNVNKDAIRIGDSPDTDVRVDPEERENAGARDRVIEVFRDGDIFRIHSIGNREISAQGETAIDRKVEAGEEIRFGAWGPVFVVGLPGRIRAPEPKETTAPIPPLARDPEASGKRRRGIFGGTTTTDSGEKPVGPKTVYMMIQDALGKARETDAGTFQRGTIFVREMVAETIQHATRSLKIGLALLAGAFLILAFILGYNIVHTGQQITAASAAADKRVNGVRSELSGEVANMKIERDRLAIESQTLSRRLDEIARTAEGGQKAVADLKGKLRDAEEKRRALEAKMTRAMSDLEADRASMSAEKARLEKERAEAEARRQEDERKAKEEAARKSAEAAAAPESTSGTAAPAPTPQ